MVSALLREGESSQAGPQAALDPAHGRIIAHVEPHHGWSNCSHIANHGARVLHPSMQTMLAGTGQHYRVASMWYNDVRIKVY